LECLWKTAVQQQDGFFGLDLDSKAFLTTAKDDLSCFKDTNLDPMLDELESERVMLFEASQTLDPDIFSQRYYGLIDSVAGCYMLPLCRFLIESLEAPSTTAWLQSTEAQIKAASLIRGLRRIDQMRAPKDFCEEMCEYLGVFRLKEEIQGILWIPALACRLQRERFPDCNSSDLRMI
jgi:hypothetical protein